MSYTVGTAFSGIGVPDLAARLLGMRTIWQIEKEPFCQQVLRKNFPEVETLIGDIYDAHNLPHVDLFVAGFPCQPFSHAGLRQGERDPRYLVPEMLRVIDEVRPRVVLLENVPGFASIDDGRTFKQLCGALAEMGMDVEWGHLRAADFGAPHQRERIWIVGYAARVSYQRRFSYYGNKQRARNSERAELWHEPASAGTRLGYTDRSRWGEQRRRKSVRAQQPASKCSGMVNAGSSRRNRYTWRRTNTQLQNRYLSRGQSGISSQSRLGRIIDGFACRLDGFVPYPARPGEQQHAFEPPRVTSRKDQRSPRLKALGNTMALDVAFALIASIKIWLTAQDEAQIEEKVNKPH